MKINDLEIGRAGEHLVVADLIVNGFRAFLTDQGLSYDVVIEIKNKLFKIQVKTTRQPIPVPQRKNYTAKYCFNVRRCGKGGRKSYGAGDIDIFALVALDTKEIGYIVATEVKQTMFFAPHGTIPVKTMEAIKAEIKQLKGAGLSNTAIAQKVKRDPSYVGRVLNGQENKSFSISYLTEYPITIAIERLRQEVLL